jgi:hypothetical protein
VRHVNEEKQLRRREQDFVRRSRSCLHHLEEVAKPDFASICVARMPTSLLLAANVHVIF